MIAIVSSLKYSQITNSLKIFNGIIINLEFLNIGTQRNSPRKSGDVLFLLIDLHSLWNWPEDALLYTT